MTKTILVAGAGGFIGGHLTGHFLEQGHTVLAVDKKPFHEWWQLHPMANKICADLSDPADCNAVVPGADEVYNLAADMGGMGFISTQRVACMRSVLINTNLIEAACQHGVSNYFFASSACVYNTVNQENKDAAPIKEGEAYPAMCERGYGWEKLYAEMLCQEYTAERRMETHIARFHNTYGPFGTWRGGREKAPAAICRKVAEAKHTGSGEIEIWGDGTPERSYTYITDNTFGIDQIMHCPELSARPVNLGSSEKVSVNQLVDLVEDIAGVKLTRKYVVGPRGIFTRNSDNTRIKHFLGWEPSVSLRDGLEATYAWIEKEYLKWAK